MTNAGVPVASDEYSLTQGPQGRVLLHDPYLAARERLVSSIVGHVLNGAREPVLSRVFEYWRNVDADLGKKVEEGVRAGQA